MSDAPAPSVVVLIDYQNIHLTARDVFAPPGTDAKDTLIDPVAFAERVVEVRAERQQIPEQKNAKLQAVKIYRGRPSNQHEPRLYSANQRQAANWSRDPRGYDHVPDAAIPSELGRVVV